MQIPIGQNRKRGRPGETKTAFEKQPDEKVSSSSDDSSTDSTSELLKRIDLNADNAENDTLVDASALNETADINTEINEPIIQMVVPASIVGLAIRGGGGGRADVDWATATTSEPPSRGFFESDCSSLC